MDSLGGRTKALLEEIKLALNRIGFVELDNEEKALSEQMGKPNFWQDSTMAQDVSKRQAKLLKRIEPWRELKRDIDDINSLVAMGDDSLQEDIDGQLKQISKKFDSLKLELKFNNPYDENGAIVSIYAGAGGTDAQDWVQMLFRMYVRYAESKNWKLNLLDESAGDEAGLKSVTFELDGDFTYGKLKGEHGVHRLVRQSPFNSAASRETSFAKVDVVPKIDQPEALEIDDKDLKVDVYRSGGHGGQSVNTTDSAVRITHLPTGLTVAIQNERSQLQNRELAMTILRSRLVQLQMEQHAEKLSELTPQTGANEFGSQIRNYVLHPYKQVKDLRTEYISKDPDAILNGDLDGFIDAYIDYNLEA